MRYVKKKEGNLLVPAALSNGHWQTKKQQTAHENAANVAFLPGYGKTQNRKNVWMGHGAVAGVMLIFCGSLIVQSMKFEEEDRGLAGVEMRKEQKAADEGIAADLNEGRRDLSSINRMSLRKREHFEHVLLNSYDVSFNGGRLLSEAQLRSGKTPLPIKDHKEFIQENRRFFPKYSEIEFVKTHFDSDENLNISVYRITGSRGASHVSFRTDEQGRLISIMVETQG